MSTLESIYDVPLADIEGSVDKQQAMNIAVVIPLVFAIICVILRFCSRLTTKASLWYDDWLMVPALVAALVPFGLSYWGYAHGMGRYIGVVTLGKLRPVLIEIFVSELVYLIVIAFVKCSLLALYWRIFPTRSVRIFAYVLGSITIAWLMANTVVVCLQCQPTAGFWDKAIPAECGVDLKTFSLAAAATNTVSDVVVLAMPIIACLRLQQTRVNKFLLVCVFATGFLVTIISVVRIVVLSHMDVSDPTSALNVTWSFVDVSIWTEVEQNITIISGCLPCLKPILAKMIPSILVPSSLRKRSSGSTPASERSSKKRDQASSQNAWMKIGSWRQRHLERQGFNMSELLRTDNHDTESMVACQAFATNKDDESAASNTRTVSLDRQQPKTHDHEIDLERGTSSVNTRRESWDTGPL